VISITTKYKIGKIKLIYLAIIVLFFLGCKTQEIKLTDDRIIGKYEYNMFMYTIQLQLNTDKTYSFYEESCIGKTYSEGNWTRNGTIILLTSNNNQRLDSCYVNYDLIEKPITINTTTNCQSNLLTNSNLTKTDKLDKVDTIKWSSLIIDSIKFQYNTSIKFVNCEKHFGVMNNYPIEIKNDTIYTLFSDKSRNGTYLVKN